MPKMGKGVSHCPIGFSQPWIDAYSEIIVRDIIALIQHVEKQCRIPTLNGCTDCDLMCPPKETQWTVRWIRSDNNTGIYQYQLTAVRYIKKTLTIPGRVSCMCSSMRSLAASKAEAFSRWSAVSSWMLSRTVFPTSSFSTSFKTASLTSSGTSPRGGSPLK